jgi:Uma2 family endonuclease
MPVDNKERQTPNLMSTAIPQAENRVLLSGISWATFESLLADTQNHGTRFTYDRGCLEMMSPSREHERLKRLIGRMIEAATEELAIPMSSAGSTTLKAEWKDRGLEADESYYISNEPRVRGRDEIDLRVDPPPDLAVEVEITAASIDKLAVYAALGVPEVWWYDANKLRIYQLRPNGDYTEQVRSPTFPFLPIEDLERFLARRSETDETTWIRSFREWVKTLGR